MPLHNLAEKTSRRDAFMAQTDTMGSEIEDRHYRDGKYTPENAPHLAVVVGPTEARKRGPGVVKKGFFHPPKLGELFPENVLALASNAKQ